MANISSLGQALDQIARLKTQRLTMDNLLMQQATGKKTQVFSGLGGDIIASQRARTDASALETYVNNITHADRRLKLMMNAIEDIKKQADNIADALVVAIQEGDYSELETIQSLVKNTLDFVIDTMNIRDGDRYLFAGADTKTKPISDTGLFESFLGEFVPDESDLTNPPLVASGVVGQWGDGTITTEQFMASYKSTNETIMGYSSSLTNNTAGKVFVRVDDNAEFDYTVLADTPGMKDLIMAFNVLKSLPPVEYAPGALNDPTATTLPEDTPPFPPREKQDNFFAVITDLSTVINNALDKLDDQSFKLSQVHAQITTIKVSHQTDINSLVSIISDIENVDETDVAAKILQMQTQLDASYRVTAMLSELSMTRYI